MAANGGLHWSDIPAPVMAVLRGGAVLPAHPLALDEDRAFDRDSQRALSRYYIDAGSGGLAVGVHATQFQIRDVGLYRPVLELAQQTAREWTDRPLVMIAGVIGRTAQAVEEARTARALGYHAVLLGLGALKGAGEDELVEHCAAVAREMPLVGFYLQTAVGGIPLSRAFWTRFAALDNVVAIKVAPFNRYKTLDVAFGVAAAGAEDRVTARSRCASAAVCWGTGACGPRPLSSCSSARRRPSRAAPCRWRCWRWTRRSRTATPWCSTSPTTSAAASPAATRSCAARA
jgi:hypothetical protein